jgi:hypothetical protein
MKQLVERRKRRIKEAKTIVEYHPRGRVDRALRVLKNKALYGWRTTVLFETDQHEHPEGGRVYGTDVRNGGSRLGG